MTRLVLILNNKLDYVDCSSDDERKIVGLMKQQALPKTFILHRRRIDSDSILGFTVDNPKPLDGNFKSTSTSHYPTLTKRSESTLITDEPTTGTLINNMDNLREAVHNSAWYKRSKTS